MENYKLPAYSRTHEGMGSEEFNDNAGFTKLELASLMIAQGMSANQSYNEMAPDAHARIAVMVAKDVLEEANK